MANLKSSKKSIRKIAKLTMRNKAEKSRIKTASKKLQALKESGDAEAIKTAAKALMSVIDKAGKHGVWHENKINRVKSRLTPLIFGVGSDKSAGTMGAVAAEAEHAETTEMAETKEVSKTTAKKSVAKTTAKKRTTAAEKPAAKKASTGKTVTTKKSPSKKTK